MNRNTSEQNHARNMRGKLIDGLKEIIPDEEKYEKIKKLLFTVYKAEKEALDSVYKKELMQFMKTINRIVD